ncbi:MAG: hypothetical protein ATN33_05740 [Epulopiscium sp. Nele67-Bin001]|nr:MAG: hypothetical protein ATN33_05740 [Epulopiscium sp. Nele67-Bin001]
MQRFTREEIFEDFRKNQPYEYRRLIATEVEPKWKFFCIIYDSYFVQNEMQNDLEGYIYFKPLFTIYGDLYLFKEHKSGKTRLYHPKSITRYSGRAVAEMSIARIFLTEVFIILIVLGLIIILIM